MRSLPLLAVVLVLAAACGDSLGLPQPSIPNRPDTLSLYALSGTPVSQPSAYIIGFRSVVRTDQAVDGFDFAFDIDSTGRALLLPTGALRLGRQSGIQTTTKAFDSVLVAPSGGYELDSAVAVDSGSVVIMHSRPLGCSFGITAVFYAKLQVVAIDTASGPNGRRMDFIILTDVNCGYRGLEEGLPRR
jgi:hypothetical protein